MKRRFVLVCVILLILGLSQETHLAQQKPGIVKMKVMKVRVDPLGAESVVILEDMEGFRAIPIWIGFSEANAIALEINGVVPPRPMTHDLIKNILEGLSARLERILIHDVRQNIIFARIILELNGKELPIDARPSDAIALAVRVKAPIFVTGEIYRSLSIDLKRGESEEPELSI